MRRQFLYAVVAVAAFVWHTTAAFGLKFTSTFEPIRIDARAGETQTRSFSLTLAANEQQTRFHAKVEDWWSSEDGRQSFYRPAGTVPRSCARWITLNPVESVVHPGGTLEVRTSVTVPPGTAPGGYWCVLTIDELPPPPARAGGVGMQFLASISVGVFVNVPPVVRAIQIREVNVGPKDATVRVQNTGNTPLSIEGRFEFVRANDRKPVAVAAFPRTTVVLDPAPVRLIATKLPPLSKLPSGRYLVRAILDIGLDHYIGAQKEMDVRRESADQQRP
jgi:hypothetical protein